MPDLVHERRMRERGFVFVAGIDEAGRGPLAGPVMAAAVVLPDGFEHTVLNDSKQLSEKRREAIYEELCGDDSVHLAFAQIDPAEIDRINILQATYKAMRLAFEALPVSGHFALIDGKPVRGFPVEHEAIVKGDSISMSIAAASIVAKVERDRLMVSYASEYPEYGFERHKGYGTAQHLDALQKWGPCPIHRRSFAPVSQREFNFRK